MSFLEKLGFNQTEIEEVKKHSTESLVSEMEKSEKLVTANLEFLKNLGVNNYKDIFINYSDMFLMDNTNFEDIFNKYDKEDLILKLENNIQIIEYL